MLISIIVPVYNAESYLDECIKSILSQTNPNFEVIVIDDGSTDRSGQICDNYAAQDHRIKVFHQNNAGVSAARNKGLEEVSGEWITFVDSDDYISENFLSDFVAESYFKAGLIYNNTFRFGNETQKKMFNFKNELVSIKLFLEEHMITSYGFVHSKFFGRCIIQKYNIRFNVKLHFAEDSMFILDYLKYIDSVYLSNKANYYYRDTANSLVKKLYPNDKELYLLQESKRLLEEIIDKKEIVIDKQKVDKEFQYYIYRVLKSTYSLEVASIKSKIIIKYLLKNFPAETLYLYRRAKGRGKLAYLLLKTHNITFINYFLQKLYK